MENLIQNEERSFFQERSKEVVKALVKKYSGIDDIFTYSPDLSSNQWHVVGKETTDDVVVAVPMEVEGKEVIVGVHSILSAERGRSVALHILDMDRQTLELYRLLPSELSSDVLANAVYQLGREGKGKPEFTKHQSAFWEDAGMDCVNTKFTTSSFENRARFDDFSKKIDAMALPIQNGLEIPMYHSNVTIPIVVRS